MHVGKLIRQKLQERGQTVTWFAEKLYYTRPNVYKIFARESIDTRLLKRISVILNYNFFMDLYEDVNQQPVEDVPHHPFRHPALRD